MSSLPCGFALPDSNPLAPECVQKGHDLDHYLPRGGHEVEQVRQEEVIYLWGALASEGEGQSALGNFQELDEKLEDYYLFYQF